MIVVNVFLGWTFIGWVRALAIASRSRIEPFSSTSRTFVVPPTLPLPSPGWYSDPSGAPAVERSWNGVGWTSDTRPDGLPQADWR